jgi:hypothetical protein
MLLTADSWMLLIADSWMILIKDNRIPRKQPCRSVVFFSRNLTWTALSSNQNLCCERQTTTRLSCCKNTSRHKAFRLPANCGKQWEQSVSVIGCAKCCRQN